MEVSTPSTSSRGRMGADQETWSRPTGGSMVGLSPVARTTPGPSIGSRWPASSRPCTISPGWMGQCPFLVSCGWLTAPSSGRPPKAERTGSGWYSASYHERGPSFRARSPLQHDEGDRLAGQGEHQPGLAPLDAHRGGGLHLGELASGLELRVLLLVGRDRRAPPLPGGERVAVALGDPVMLEARLVSRQR